MRLLDLFCGAGGAAMGYHRAGFEVVGVDIKPQRHYPFEFHQADALTYPTEGFDAVHASPPCQAHSSMRGMWNHKQHISLVAETLARLDESGLPYVVENVIGAPLASAVMLCGTMFKLGCEGGELRRHRLFQFGPEPMLIPVPACDHGWSAGVTVGMYGNAEGASHSQRYATVGVYGGHGRDRRRIKNGQHFATALRAEAMGIDWMTGAELSQAIPPAYTEYIGRALMAALNA